MKNPARLVTLFFLLWLVCFTLSFVIPYSMEAKGDGFTRGLNRLGALMGWQLAAFVSAIVVFFVGMGRLHGRRGLVWLSRGPLIVQATLVAAIVGLIGYTRFASQPASSPDIGSIPTKAAPAINIPPPPADAIETTPTLTTFTGIYRRGFEASHFYSTDGRGPWWTVTSAEADQALAPFHVEGPGRSGGVAAALKVSGWLTDDVDDVSYLGDFQGQLHIETIESVRPLSAEEFETVKTAFLSQQE